MNSRTSSCLCLCIWLLCLLESCSTEDNFCEGSKVISTDTGGEIVSHSGVGQTDYLSNMNCNWEIIAPRWRRIVARFSYVDLENRYDKVTIYNGVRGSGIIAVVSGRKENPETLPAAMSTSNVMTVSFLSDKSNNRKGFRLRFTIVQYCNGRKVVSGSSGEIVSHIGIGHVNYDSISDCYWEIRVQPGEKIKAWFTYFDLEPVNDTVTIYDGSVRSPVLAVVTNATLAAHDSSSFVSSSNIMTVYFKADVSVTAGGFRLRYISEAGANTVLNS